MTAYLTEWLNLLGRGVHLVTGIAWIGASFYFVWLDNHLLAPDDTASAAKGVGGELWAVHGGGFYNAQKYRVAPRVLPPTLHWFYWEAYSTFLSGFFLLSLLYYAHAEIYLIDPRVAVLSKPAAIAMGIGTLAGGWLIYDALCRSSLAQHGRRLGAVIAVLLGLAAFGLCHVFSGRGAFMEFGAMLGTIMVANVFFVIIPGQRAMVAAKRAGRDPDPQAGLRGKMRSVHNTYFTLPVLFTMLSNHYALTFGARYNWLVLIALCAAGAMLRVYFVARHTAHARGGRTAAWPALLGLAILAGTALALAPTPPLARNTPAAGRPAPGTPAAGSPAPQFTAIQRIVTSRCAPCHAATPSQAGFVAAPKGLRFDSPAAILSQVAIIEPQVATRAMPIGNLTQMTEPERAQLLDWIAQGAPH